MKEERDYVDTAKTITHVSLCAGYAGLDRGISRAIPTARTIAFSEIEAYAIANLVAKMEAGALDPAPIWTNLKTFPWEQFRGLVDILSGGFPCQPWSHAGKRNGDEDPRHLFPYILAGIKVCRPSAVFLENVEGIVSAKLAGDGWADPAGTPVLLHVVRELERAGYACAWGLFSAAEVGAPHQRKRVFILALEHTASFDGWGLPFGAEPPLPVAGEPGELVHPRLLGPQVGELPPAGPLEPSGGLADHPGAGAGHHHEGLRPRVGGIGGRQGADRWPARPDQPQYAWEPPRVVSKGELLCGKLEALEQLNAGCCGEGATQPALGRTPHGTSHRLDPSVRVDSRVDELRLLGNGVVPATAAKAFLTLFGRLTAGLRGGF